MKKHNMMVMILLRVTEAGTSGFERYVLTFKVTKPGSSAYFFTS